MNHTILVEAGSCMRAMARGMAPAVMVSATLHLVVGLLLLASFQGRVDDPSLRSPQPQTIELEIVQFAPREPVSQFAPREPVRTSETRPSEQHQSAPEPVPEPAPEPAPEPRPLNSTAQDLWPPLPSGIRQSEGQSDGQSDGENKKLGRFLSLATCPRFIDPSDLALVDRCAGRTFARSESDTEVASNMAKQFEREAIERGWAVVAVPVSPEQARIERESTRQAPAADVFGPWPWD